MSRRPRRPAMLDAYTAESIVGDLDPAVRTEMAHTTAGALVSRGRDGAGDPALVERLVTLVDAEGIDVIAALWADSPARTLPGALWRLYLLREWVRRDPRTIAERYRLGIARAEVAGVIAGVAEPPGPEEVRSTADAVLAGVYEGELDVALDRAASFFRVLATGTALDADWIADTDDEHATRVTRRAGALLGTAEELTAAAEMARDGRLD